MITEYCGSPSEFNDISINDIECCPQWLSYVVPSETIIEVPEITIISPENNATLSEDVLTIHGTASVNSSRDTKIVRIEIQMTNDGKLYLEFIFPKASIKLLSKRLIRKEMLAKNIIILI